jgi:very-short-patch-repair endonuclease
VEIDGGQHRLDDAVAADAERDRYLRAHGYRVCRIPQLIAIQETGTALERIRAVIGRRGQERRSSPLPPRPRARGNYRYFFALARLA